MTDPSQMSDAELMAALGLPAAGNPTTARPMASAVPTSSAPRGVRNNNPGNVEDGDFARSLPGYAGSDGRFARFDSPEAGEQVAPRLLASYVQRGFDTPAEIINRWAPPSDNNPTAAYAQYVAQRAGLGVNDRVTEQHIPLIAQAIKEFENGQRPTGNAPAAASAGQDVTALGDEELMALLDTPEAVTAERGASRESAIDLGARLMTDDVPRLKQGAWVRNGDEIYQLPGDAYQASPRESDQGTESGAYIRRPNLSDSAEAFATAASEQIPFMDEAVAGVAGATTGRGYDAVRTQQMLARDLSNQTDRTARVAGGLAGFGAGFFVPGSGWVSGGRAATRLAQGARAGSGAMRLVRAGRAATLGAGMGAVYGAGNSDGDLSERLQSAAIGAGLGGATGGLFQGGFDRFAAASRAAQAAPASDQRLISRLGVDLTPGQMMGGFARTAEDAIAGTVPVLGDAIQSARRTGLNTFDNAATNLALGPTGQTLTRAQSAGRGGVRAADDVVSGAYNNALDGVQVAPDTALAGSLQNVQRPDGLTRTVHENLTSTLDNIFSQVTGPVDGQTWKRVDSELAAAARAAERGSQSAPEQRVLRDRLSDARDAWGEMLARTDQAAFDAVNQADEASAMLRIVRKGSSDVGSAARGGDTSPGSLNRAVATSGSDGGRRYGRGENLLQGFSDAAQRVLPNTVPNSGTAMRGLVGGGLLGAGAMSQSPAVLPAVATVAAGALAYSRPVQIALNAVYRSTDRPGAVQEGLATLARLARQNPDLVPIYEGALRHSMLASPSEGQGRTPASRGLFGARSPQMAPQ